MKKINKETLTFKNILPYVLIIAGVIGCIASFVLTHEKIHVLQDPSYVPSCNINPILSCGSVMNSAQADLFGVPNTIFGLVAFSMLFTFGVMIASGAQVKRWVWLGAQAAATVGVIFMHYLFLQGVYVLHAICPWCFIVWIITIPAFWYITLYNLREKIIKLPAALTPASAFAQKYHGDILIIWYLIIFGIILEHFWYFWSTLFR